MAFEVKQKDMLARLGSIRTRSGTIETPALLPVINPSRMVVTPKEMHRLFGCEAVITNAYIVKKNFGEDAKKSGIHGLLDYPLSIMTDSGAYQLLIYGEVDVSPEEIVRYQEEIGSDIATILDVPTGWGVSRRYAAYTVEETIRRAKELTKLKRRDDLLWVGPIQGGQFTDLIVKSAREMGTLNFDIHALGSPTPVMERYLFDVLVDMIVAAKSNIPPDRPLHLFGAGHPFMFALVVLLGCDLFDSAAYSLFARSDRYMTEKGTIKLSNLEYLPCSCPICLKRTPKELLEMPKNERERELSIHNLHVCFTEMKRIKQAITEGRLWEHVEVRAYGHPALLQALRHLKKYVSLLEEGCAVSKDRGLFFFSHVGTYRPEVFRYRKRFRERYREPEKARVLLLIQEFLLEPPKRVSGLSSLMKALRKKVGDEKAEEVHICFCTPPFGLVPYELKGVYPLSQFEAALPPDLETMKYTVDGVEEYLRDKFYRSILVLRGDDYLGRELSERCRNICRLKGINYEEVILKGGLKGKTANNVVETISSLLNHGETE